MRRKLIQPFFFLKANNERNDILNTTIEVSWF